MSAVDVQQINTDLHQPINHLDKCFSELALNSEETETSKLAENETINVDSFNVKIVIPGQDPFDQEVSSMELVQDIHQILMDKESTCHKTCFSLYIDGQLLDNFSEIKTISSIKEGVKINVVDNNYSLREAKNHIKHVQDLLRSLEMSDAFYGREMSSLSFMNNILSSALSTSVFKREDRDSSPIVSSSTFDFPDFLIPHNDAENLSSCNNITNLSLLALYPMPKDTIAPKCLRLLDYSIWNPPPPNRRLQGDLLYLTVLTLTNKRYHITACPKGFYLNQSTEEVLNHRPNISNNHPTACFNHSIIDLLKALCPTFKRNFDQLLRLRSQKHPLERIPCPFQTYPWIIPQLEHTIDHCKREETFCSKMVFEENLPGQTREWNEELQSSRELPRNSLIERIVRERAIFKSYSDFVASATRAAIAVVNGNIMPINPGEDFHQQMFIWNNIFFSLGFDVKDHYLEYGGNAAAFAATASDLNGISIMSSHDFDSIYTLGTSIIDYRGYRVTSQTIIPGILEKEQEQSVVYGSIDFGKTVVTNEKYLQILEKCASVLKIRPHRVLDSKGDAKLMQSSVECKGIIGNDQRHYVLDLLRCSPPDINFMPNTNDLNRSFFGVSYPIAHPHKMPVLRHEMVEIFTEGRYISFLRYAAKMLHETRSDSSMVENGIDTKQKLAGCEAEFETVKQLIDESSRSKAIENSTLEVIKKAAESVGSLSDTHFYLAFNPDVYQNNIKFPDSDSEEIKRDMNLVAEICDFLVSVQIPRFVEECLEQRIVPIDSSTLVEALHQNGINVRYLGHVYLHIKGKKSVDYLENLVVSEMVVRMAKRILREYLQNIDALNLAASVAHFLNCFIGSCAQPHTVVANEEIMRLTKKRNKAKKGKNTREGTNNQITPTGVSWTSLSPVSLWSEISSLVESYFHIEFQCSDIDSLLCSFSISRLCLLRNFCQTNGIQIALKEYQIDHKNKTIFSSEDIVSLFPKVKHIRQQATDAQTLFASGQSRISQGALVEANWLLTESLNLFNQIYGPLNIDSANCNRLLGRLAYVKGDYQNAVMFQQRSLIITERILGVDSAVSGQEYSHLALYYFTLGQFSAALQLMYRSRYIALINHGDNHPDIAMIDTNIGLMLHSVEDFDKSLLFLQNALRLNCKFFGASSLKVALSSHLVARTYSCRGDFRLALTLEKDAYAIYKTKLGETNERTIESNECLKLLTEQAVEFAKRVHDINKSGSKFSAQGGVAGVYPAFYVPRPSLSNLVDTLNLVNGIFVIQLSPDDVERLQREIKSARQNLGEV